jgi:hypothetical protein
MTKDVNDEWHQELDKGAPRRAWPPYWTGMRTLGNTSAAKAVILVPVIGYWILLNDHIMYFAALFVDKAQVVSWRLFARYFRLWLIGVGSAVYQIWCPAVIKLYGSGHEYVGTAANISDMEDWRADEALRKGDEASKAERHRIVEVYRSEPIKERMQRQRRETLQAHFDYCNRRYVFARWGASTFYVLGFIALSAASVDVFFRVLMAFARGVLGVR